MTNREVMQQALEALIDASNVLSAPMFPDAVAALSKALEQPEQTKLTDDADTLTIVYQRGRAIEGAHGIKENTFEGNSCSSATPSTPHPPQQQAEPVACVACEGRPKGDNIPCAICGATPPQRGWQELTDSGKRGSIALARQLCYEIAGATSEDDDINGRDYGSVDVAEILSAEVVRLQKALAQPKQEPVAYYHPRNGFYWAKPTSIFAPTVVDVPPIPLYTAAQREWAGLTDEDWEKVANRKNTVLDTFEQGATWAAYKLERRNK
ncbi:hypothetical protein UFOVP1176_36 [uncultured Caudovirales phage]|uniref:Uncharacterized protein n=1 Tax=uncultured Caudovirales phage TaxID=2100421 RepID=A0A6J5R7I8_9CAUD|nr:hypothetical protein UFOVP1176_36 [uncultured Caudovirales phage]